MKILLGSIALWIAFVTGAECPTASHLGTLPSTGYGAATRTRLAGQATNNTSETLKIDATLVSLDVMVTDEDGRVLSGLKGGNFSVLDNGVPQKVLSFTSTSAPMTVVILMEYNSASYSYFAQKASVWATGFLNHLEPQDWVALITFDVKPKVQVDFTHKRYEVRDAVTTLGPPIFSEANLFDSIIDTLDKLDGVRGKKSILLIASGANSFSAANFDEVSERLKRTDATIFCVGLAEAEYMRYGGGISYLQEKNWLTTFAKQTGGIALFPRFEGELPEIFRSVVAFERNEYNLTFRPPKENRDGRYHRLRVEIVGSDGKSLRVTDPKGRLRKVEVYAREGYVAPQDKAP
jgi:VWFA-related protein